MIGRACGRPELLISGLAGHRGMQRLTAVLYAYFDESGKLADSDFICMCGYLCDERWNEFAGDWRHELRRSQIPFLHTAPLFARVDPYAGLGWTEATRDAVLSRLAAIVARHALVGFGFAVDAKYYRQISPADRNLIGGRNPEMFIFHRILHHIVAVLKEWDHREPISLIFDWEEGYASKCLGALASLRRYRAEVRQFVGSICFADDATFPPLQAADMLAYATKRNLQGNPPAYWATLTEPRNGEPPPAYRSEYYDADALRALPQRVRDGVIKLLG